MTRGAELGLDVEEHARQVLAWRAQRVARLTAPDSWLSLIGKHWLEHGLSTLGSDETSAVVLPADKAPPLLASLYVDGSGVRLEPVPGVELRLREGSTLLERPLSEPVVLRTDAHGTPDRVLFGSLSLEIMERAGGSFALRTRDLESRARLSFPGISYFPVEPSWRVRARLEPYSPPKRIELEYEAGKPQAYESPGALVFEHLGVTYRLDPVLESAGARLFILFRDQTSGLESYGAGRFLYAPLPEQGEVWLDFNQAFSPPCAFTEFAACPLPPPQNRLPVRVEAGEKAPGT